MPVATDKLPAFEVKDTLNKEDTVITETVKKVSDASQVDSVLQNSEMLTRESDSDKKGIAIYITVIIAGSVIFLILLLLLRKRKRQSTKD